MGRTGRARSGRCVVLATTGTEANSFRTTLSESKKMFAILQSAPSGGGGAGAAPSHRPRLEFTAPAANAPGRMLPAGLVPRCEFVRFDTQVYAKAVKPGRGAGSSSKGGGGTASIGFGDVYETSTTGGAYLSIEEERELESRYLPRSFTSLRGGGSSISSSSSSSSSRVGGGFASVDFERFYKMTLTSQQGRTGRVSHSGADLGVLCGMW